MKVLVTGASGFLGKHLVARLHRDGCDVIAVGRPQLLPVYDTRVRNVTDETSFVESSPDILDGIEAVYHLAWSSLPTTASAQPSADAAVNVLGSIRLMEALRDKNAVRFIFASSGGTVYGPAQSIPILETHATKPVSAYGVSKLSVENYLRFFHQAHGLRSASLRIANLFGPGQSFGRKFGVIATFAASILKGELITIYGDGTAIRDYIYVDDVIDAFVAAGDRAESCDYINIGMGKGHSLNDIITLMEHQLDRTASVQFVQSRTIDVPASVVNIEHAKDVLDWQPRVSFDDAVQRTIRDVQKRL